MHRSSHRILVVDDEAKVRRLIATVLRKKGYAAVEAWNARVALGCLQREEFDLVITDLKMPGMDGLALVTQSRTLYPETDVIVLTAYGTIQSAVEAMQRGAVDYMTKPFSIAGLAEKVSHCFEDRDARIKTFESPIQPLVELNQLLSSKTDLADTLDGIMDLAKRTFLPTAMEVTILEASLQKEPIVVRSGERLPERFYPHLGCEQIRDLAQRAEPWLLTEAGDSHSGGVSITVPILSNGEVVGTLTLVRERPSPGYTQADVQLLQVFGVQIALGMLHSRTHQRMMDAFHDLKRASLSAVRALFEALGTYDKYTRDHSERVSRYACMLGEAIGLSPDQVEVLSIGGLLHDIGKLGVSDATLRKNERLTADEIDQFRLHPVSGARILEDVDALQDTIPIVLHHHERYDGEGYPDHLAGEDIPLNARIIAVVDTFDSMISDRPYRPALTLDETLARLRACVDTQLDGRLVEAWIGVVLKMCLEDAVVVGGSDSYAMESEQRQCMNVFSS